LKKRSIYLVAFSIAAFGVLVFLLKLDRLGLPLAPNQDTAVWTIEARARFDAKGGPLTARLEIPAEPLGFEILDEDFISSNYGVTTENDELHRTSIWTVRRAKGKQSVYYRMSVVEADTEKQHTDAFPGFPDRPERDEALDSAIDALLAQVRDESADTMSFTGALIRRVNKLEADGAVGLLNDGAVTTGRRALQLVDILASARIPARVVWGILLEDEARDAPLLPYVEVHNQSAWTPFDPISGKRGYPDGFLVWYVGSNPPLELEGAKNGEVQFAVARTLREMVDVAAQRAQKGDSMWFDFSLFALPIQTQNVYRVLLTVPLGAFLVVLLRGFVGIKTFGTFMPVLIALAFRETELYVGILLFVTIVGLGLWIRFLLERLQLLLVPRLAAVLTIVVLLMLAISVVSFHLGMDTGISVALFPMVILAMTIERMSLVWEETGGRDAIVQGLGSLIVASACFLVVSNEQLAHLAYVFPELLLVVLAASILAGRYTGYRLFEFWRFRSVWRGDGGESGRTQP
jgi:7 transmembrane helices usually fused to an inactive transglutaminase/Inactive transglutaminase fused to 7 transmembrane helices